MTMFRRRRAEVPDTAPSATFPFWSSETADRFRALVRSAFAGMGLEVTVCEAHVVDAAGRGFGLANLAASCHQDPRGERAWPGIIARHVATIVAATDQPSAFDAMSYAEVLAATYARVMAAADVPSTMGYAIPIAPGLARVLNLDLPTAVAYFDDDRVAQLGAADVQAAGMANLRRVRPDRRETVPAGGGAVEVLLGESPFTASLVLVLDEVVARYGHQVDPEVGVLVAVPNRHQLDYHVPRDGSVVPAMNTLVRLAAAGYRDAPGAVSPDVYWWRPGRVERVARATPDGAQVEVGPELSRVLMRLRGE